MVYKGKGEDKMIVVKMLRHASEKLALTDMSAAVAQIYIVLKMEKFT